MNKADIPGEAPDFSLVLGGPLFQLLRRARLSGAALELAWRRVLVIALLAWLPLLVLSLIGGTALDGGIKIPFLYDIEAHIRFLVALPILIAAELIVDSRIRPTAKRFVEGRLIVGEDIPRLHRAIDSAMRLRNSVAVEVTLLVLVYPLGFWIWRSQIATGTMSWYSIGQVSPWHLTAAGYWYAFVSIPFFQFILLRWYVRFFIWFLFLWRVSRLNLRLNATHPDRAGGLGFLGSSSYAFSPILFAQGAMLSGLIASRVLYDGQKLVSFKMEAGGLVVFFMAFIVSPLLVFAPQLARAKRRTLRDYGLLTTRYVQDFEMKWIQGGVSKDEVLLGNTDVQSLADLGNSFSVISETRLVPFGVKDLARLAAATAAPLLPLVLTIFSFEELVTRLLRILL
jgi:hypothetical protein